ncbi:hypothetical protein HN451_03020 [archaeon]|nr:hypothetical protein [archaeon]
MITSVSALYEEKIFDGWVESGKKFAIDGENYTATYIIGNNLTVVRFPGNYQDVIDNNESCKEGWIYKTCLMDKKFKINDKEVPWHIHAANIDISLELEMYASYSNIDIQKTIGKENLLTKETAEVILILNNTGKLESDIVATDYYGPAFHVVITEGLCKEQNNRVVFSTHLKPQRFSECKYIIKALRNGSFENNISVNYTVMDRSRVSEEQIIIEIENSAILVEPRNLDIITEPSLNKTIWMNLSATQDIEVQRFSLIFPENIVLIDTTEEYHESTDSTFWRANMEENEVKNLSFNIKSDLVVNSSIKYVIDYISDGLAKTLEGTYFFESTQDFFYAGLVNISNRTVFRVANPTNNVFKDIKIRLLDGEKIIEEMEIDELGKLRFKEYNLTKTTDSYEIDFKTIFGQPLSVKNELSFIKIENIFENLTRYQDHVKEEEKEILEEIIEKEKKWSISDININWEIIGIAAGVFIVGILVVVLFNKPKQDSIEKEIEDLKKQEKQENEEEQNVIK